MIYVIFHYQCQSSIHTVRQLLNLKINAVNTRATMIMNVHTDLHVIVFILKLAFTVYMPYNIHACTTCISNNTLSKKECTCKTRIFSILVQRFMHVSKLLYRGLIWRLSILMGNYKFKF